MFPHPKNSPAGRLKVCKVPPIASPVAREFRVPIGGVRPGRGSVQRATVPEASIDEDNQALSRERDVNTNLAAGYRHGVIDSIAQPMGVQ